VESMIRLEDITKRYRVEGLEVRALDGVDFEAKRGEFVAVAGPSGSGKSTLLMMLGGLARPSEGRVLFDGADLYGRMGEGARSHARADRIGFVFQTFQLMPYLNAIENVLVPALAGGRPTAALEKRARELLDHLGLAERARHRPSELSAGERQRVALARALLREPDVLLADEPTGNLDADAGRQVIEHFKEFQGAGGTIVMVTHDDRLAADADRLVRLDRGKVVAA